MLYIKDPEFDPKHCTAWCGSSGVQALSTAGSTSRLNVTGTVPELLSTFGKPSTMCHFIYSLFYWIISIILSLFQVLTRLYPI